VRRVSHSISAIVPTIGRPASLTRLLDALAVQTRRPDEIVVADSSINADIEQVASAPRWRDAGLSVRHIRVAPPNAVGQRKSAIAESRGSLLLLLDDDVVPEPDCVAALISCLESCDAVAVGADFSNQRWPEPTTLWRWYLRRWHHISGPEWQGKVIGPLLRFGYHPVPATPVPMQWLGSGHALIRRDAYDRAGGFSDFFLHRSSINEDVDLGLKLGQVGRLLLCPAARMAHLHDPGGRASARLVAEDDLYNRYCVLRYTQRRSRVAAAGLTLTFFAIETLSGLAAMARGWRTNGFGARLVGRLQALIRIATS
jgi:GT2 family glycosyltransferase